MKFGFTFTADPSNHRISIPLCVVCGYTLANSAMVPSKMKRHLETNHGAIATQDKDFFVSLKYKKDKEVKQQATLLSRSTTNVSENSLELSYQIAEILAKAQVPHTLAERVIVPVLKLVANSPVDKKEFTKIPLSNSTIGRRIEDMSADIESVVINKIKTGGKFALQLDESTDVSGHAQLLANVRFIDGDIIRENYLFCKQLPGKTTGEEVFRVTSEYLEQCNLSWENCVSVCTDGAASMTGRYKGFVSRVKEVNPNVMATHCFLHREALVAKTLPKDLSAVLDDAVHIVNFIKARPLKSRLFATLCEEMGSDHTTLLLHTEVRWLSRGKVLSRVYELREELQCFLSAEQSKYAELFGDEYWCARLAYMADIFNHLNALNRQMQGRNENILSSTDKLRTFRLKLAYWRKSVGKGELDMFPHCTSTPALNGIISQHLETLEEKFAVYFPSASTEAFDWVRDPFNIVNENSPWHEQEQLFDIQGNYDLKMKFKELSLDSFWLTVAREYPAIADRAIAVLRPFSTTYLCELSFSRLTYIKNRHRERLRAVDQELRVSLSSISARVQTLCSGKQAQVSH